MTPHGELTEKLAETISPYWNDHGFSVFHDHGRDPYRENVGKIVSTLNKDYHNGDELSQLDIAIVKKDSNKIFILVEIEETTGKPKTFLGDIFGVLFGEHIFFKRKELFIEDITTLIVVGVNKTDHPARNKSIQDQVKKAKTNLTTRNARIGEVMVETYENKAVLTEQLPLLLESLFKGNL